MNVILKQLSETDRGQACSYALKAGPTLVGRSSNCSLIVSSQSVSRWHCILDVSSDGVQVTNLHSLNGTYVNDRRIIRELLKNDDYLRIGEVPFLVNIDSVEQGVNSAGALVLPALPDGSLASSYELAPTDFAGISAVSPRSIGGSKVPSRKGPDKSAALPVPVLARQLANYEQALNNCSAQLRLLIEKVTSLEAKLDAVNFQKAETKEQSELATQKAFERHDAMMYIARAAVCDKLRQQSQPAERS